MKPKPENAVQENPRAQFVNAWNQYIFQKGDHSNIKTNKYSGGSALRRGRRFNENVNYNSIYGFNKFDLSTYEFLNDDPSLFNFMLANVDDYPTWEFTPEKNINIFDL